MTLLDDESGLGFTVERVATADIFSYTVDHHGLVLGWDRIMRAPTGEGWTVAGQFRRHTVWQRISTIANASDAREAI